MCRNIKLLFNLEPPVNDEGVRAAALQYVRKISGFNKPSKANEVAFYASVDEVAAASSRLLTSLQTNAPPRNREVEAAKARTRAARKFASRSGGSAIATRDSMDLVLEQRVSRPGLEPGT
jgi:hypothetical protein